MIALTTWAPSVMAQQGPAPPSPPAASRSRIPESKPPTPPPSPDAAVPALATQPGPALREGGYLVEVRGTLRRDTDGWSYFRVQEAGAAPGDESAIYEMPILPCELLSHMQRLLESTSPGQFTFDLTGQVFAYHGRNYLLPTHAPRLKSYAPRSERPRATPASGPGRAANDDSGRAALERLDREVGDVARSPRSGAAQGAAAEDGDDPDGDGGPQEGQRLLWRRGRLTRQNGGAWSFVFDAGATGRQDLPMTVMPCLLLERMEKYVTAGAPSAAMLVSGRVYLHGSKVYLLPTAFEIPRQRTILSP